MAIYKNIKSCLHIPLLIILLLTGRCKKAVEAAPPPTQIVGSQAFADNTTAIAVVNSVYSAQSQRQFSLAQGAFSIGLRTSQTGDELFGSAFFYFNQVTPENLNTNYFWYDAYTNIYTCNAVLEGLPSSSGVDEGIKKQLLAEMKFMRAFFYFYLVNLFGDVPLPTTTDYRVNRVLPRTPEAQVYALILQDLKEAQADLAPTFVDGFLKKVPERIRPNKMAANAMLARVYLYLQDWSGAAAHATKVIDQPEIMLESNLDNVFLWNSKEAILQFQPKLDGQNVEDSKIYVLDANGLNAGSSAQGLRPAFATLFDSADLRYRQWVGKITVPALDTLPSKTFYFPYKYKIKGPPAPTTTTEYLMVLRLAEQYLIRAEARAQLGDVAGAQEDLNKIRTRAGLTPTRAATQQELLDAVMQERQWELFTEWGHRWFDLKRTGRMDSVMMRVAAEKGTVWQPHFKLFPIPQSEITANGNLVQNPGY